MWHMREAEIRQTGTRQENVFRWWSNDTKRVIVNDAHACVILWLQLFVTKGTYQCFCMFIPYLKPCVVFKILKFY